MRGYRTVVLGAVALCTLLMAPTAALAENYPPPAVDAPPEAVAGEDVPFTGEGFKAESDVDINVTYSTSNSGAALRADHAGLTVLAGMPVPRVFVKTVTTDGSGAFATTIPLAQAGTATITGTGVDPTGLPFTLSKTVVVTEAAGNANPSVVDPGIPAAAPLPVTGMSGRTLAMDVTVGAAAILFGATIIWMTVIWRRRVVRQQP